jgi:hypothetical protein
MQINKDHEIFSRMLDRYEKYPEDAGSWQIPRLLYTGCGLKVRTPRSNKVNNLEGVMMKL